MSKVVVSFLIPLREDTEIGTDVLHPPYRWKCLHDVLITEFGGWTKGAQVEGAWRSESSGQIIYDESRSYSVDVDEERLQDMRELLGRACITFVQQCIRVVIRGEAEYIQGDSNDQSL